MPPPPPAPASGMFRAYHVARLAHDLRLPLTGIRGFAELVLSDTVVPLPWQHRPAVEAIRRNAEAMSAMVADLLDLGSLGAGGLRLDIAAMSLSDLVDDARAAAGPRLAGHRMTWPEPGDARVIGDRRRLGRLIANLLDNAAKFTPAGGQVVFAAAVDGTRLELCIADDGPSIPPAERDRAFHAFTKGNEPPDGRPRVGVGLGLSIVHAIAAAHGGAAVIEDAPDLAGAPGHGCRFRIAIPQPPHPGTTTT